MKKENTITICLFVTILVFLIGVVAAEVVTTVNLSKRIDNLNKQVEELKTTNNRNETTIVEEIPEEPVVEYDVSSFKEIKPSDIKKDSQNSTILIMIGRKTCYYCQLYAPILTEVSKEYQFQPRYIDLEKLVNLETGEVTEPEEVDYLVQLEATEEYKNFMDDFGATPMTLIVKEEKIVGGIMGYTPKENLIEQLKDLGFIN